MDDLISRAHVKALINSMWWDTIDSIPAVDAVEVRHGEWRPLNDTDEWYGELYACSKCNDTMIGENNFCPNCGARMDGRREDGDGDAV